MLVHICCSVDSHYFLTRLHTDFPHEKLIGYFYNPNIFPKSEYELRLVDAKRSCERLGVAFLEGVYDDDNWAQEVVGLENEPEKGARCEVCFDVRFENSARKAKELGLERFTSTLLQSPLKDKSQLKNSLSKISLKHGVNFVFVDYLSGGGKEAQSKTSHEEGLYRQNYCGCVWGVINQRESGKKLAIECFSPVDKVKMPCSSEKRLDIYNQFANEQKVQKSVKSKVLNYRVLSARVIINGEVVPSFVLAYSLSNKKSWGGAVDFERDGVVYLKRESAKLIELSRFCEITGVKYSTVSELLSSPPSFEEQVKARMKLSGYIYDLSPIFVVESISNLCDIKLELDSFMFEDTDESA